MRRLIIILVCAITVLLAQNSWIGNIPSEARNNPNIPKIEKPKTETAPKILEGQPIDYVPLQLPLNLSRAPRSYRPKETILEPAWTDAPDETLHYDGNNYDGIGLTSGGTFYGAVRFTPVINCTLKAILFYQYQAAQNGYVYVLGPGTDTTPGAVLESVPYTGTGTGWKRVDLTTFLIRNASVDFWTCVRTTHGAGQYPLGIDSGPMVLKRGGFIATALSGPWFQLAQLDLNYNWNQRAIIAAIPYANDMATISIDNLGSPERPNQWLTFKATVKNVGTTTRPPGVPVRLLITGPGAYTYSDNDQVTLTTLAYNQTEQITFVPNWRTPTTLGTYTIKVWTDLATDQSRVNDTAVFLLEVSNWITYANWANPFYITWIGRERSMIFYPVEFGLSYPIRIDSLKTQFESIPSRPWISNQYQFIVYSRNLRTVLHTSPILNAVRGPSGTFVGKYAIPAGLTIDSGAFMVAVRTTNSDGFPSTLGDNDHDFRSVYGDTLQWYYWTPGEFFIASFVTWTARSTDVGFNNLRVPYMYTRPGVAINPVGVVKNYGTVTQTSVPCSCFVFDTTTDARIYSGATTVGSVIAGDTARATFSPAWTPPAVNNVYLVEMATFLPVDSNRFNDAIYHVFFGFQVYDTMVASSRTVLTTIDGYIQTSEWADANKYDISNILGWKDPFYRYYPGNVFIYFKHDANNLYVAIDQPFVNTNDTSEIGLYFDENNNGAWASDSSEGNFWVENFPDTIIYRSLPSGWRTRVLGAVHRQGISSGHLQYEMSLPLGSAKYQLNLNPSGDTAGFYTYALNWEYYNWLGWWKTTMDSIYWNQPAYYGKLVLSPYIAPPPDVGVTSINAPVGTIDSAVTIVPQATLRNFGLDEATFDAYFWIKDSLGNTLYNDVITVLNLAGGTSIIRSFDTWPKPHAPGPYTTRCSTYIAGDINHSNDTLGGLFRVTSPPSDVGVVSINAPTGTLDTTALVIPQATLRNFGSVAVDFKTFFTIKDSLTNITVYFDSLMILGLASSSSTTRAFDTWPKPHAPGPYLTRCSTYIAGDINPVNDFLNGTFQVIAGGIRVDAALDAILAPTGTIDTFPVVPSARVKNNNLIAIDIPVSFIITGPKPYTSTKTALAVPAGGTANVLFDLFNLVGADTGNYTTKCTTMVVGDTYPANDFKTGTFIVKANPPGVPGEWVKKADIAFGEKPVSKGGCLAFFPDSGWIYALKGNNKPAFGRYSITGAAWTQLADMPYALDKEKKPKAGAAMVRMGDYLYVPKGGNRLEFWRYGVPGADSLGWKQLLDVPAGGKKVKGGTVLAPVKLNDTDYIFMAKGSKTSEGYLYNPATNTWGTALSGVPLFDKSTSGAGFNESLVYAITYYKATKTNTVFLGNLKTNTWTQAAVVPLIASSGKRKKIKEGSALTTDGTKFYMFKGGNVKEFFDYTPGESVKQRADIPITTKKGVKGGASLAFGNGYVWAFPGNKLNEFWQYTPVLPTVAAITNTPSLEGAMDNKLATGAFKLVIVPNPAINQTAISYSLPVPGPVNFKLYNVTGALVKSFANTTPTKDGVLMLDTKTFASGVYLLRFNAGDIRVTIKLVLEK